VLPLLADRDVAKRVEGGGGVPKRTVPLVHEVDTQGGNARGGKGMTRGGGSGVGKRGGRGGVSGRGATGRGRGGAKGAGGDGAESRWGVTKGKERAEKEEEEREKESEVCQTPASGKKLMEVCCMYECTFLHVYVIWRVHAILCVYMPIV